MQSIWLKTKTYDIAIWCPRHNIPFDGDIPIRIQRIKRNCINVTNVMFEVKKNNEKTDYKLSDVDLKHLHEEPEQLKARQLHWSNLSFFGSRQKIKGLYDLHNTMNYEMSYSD